MCQKLYISQLFNPAVKVLYVNLKMCEEDSFSKNVGRSPNKAFGRSMPREAGDECRRNRVRRKHKPSPRFLPAGGAVPLGIPGLSLPSGYRDWPSKRI